MATRSLICAPTSDGKFRAIYCHWNGQPIYNGKVLKQYYTDPEMVDKLLDLGYLSCLGKLLAPPVGVPHSFDNPAPDVTVAYHRDRGQMDTETVARIIGDIWGLGDYANSVDADYVWLFDPNTKVWSYAKTPYPYNSRVALEFTPYP